MSNWYYQENVLQKKWRGWNGVLLHLLDLQGEGSAGGRQRRVNLLAISWESHRCLITRQNEHNAGLDAKKEDNALYKHQQLFRQGEECNFSFEAEQFFKDAMSHKIYEGVCINNSPSTPGYLMNSRAEYEQGAVARLNVQHGL